MTSKPLLSLTIWNRSRTDETVLRATVRLDSGGTARRSCRHTTSLRQVGLCDIRMSDRIRGGHISDPLTRFRACVRVSAVRTSACLKTALPTG